MFLDFLFFAWASFYKNMQMFHMLLTMFSHLEEKAHSEVLAMRGFQHSSIARQERLETRQCMHLLFNYIRKLLKR